MNKKEIDLLIAKQYYKVYQALLKRYHDEKIDKDFNDYIEELEKKRYISKGRQLTDEEIIMYEINNLDKYLISDKFEKNEFKDELFYLYRFLLKAKINYNENLNFYYKDFINKFYCLCDKIPPFFTDVSKVCKKVESMKKIKEKK